MYRKLKVAVVIPAYNEEKLIEHTLTTVPDFVDYIVTVNDGSKDNTLKIQKKLAAKNKRIIVVNNEVNLGLGASMVRGYKRVLETDADMVGIMSGDAQCEPQYLTKMTERLVSSDADYVKANRFADIVALQQMPPFRRFGNILITLLTKFSTGYYSIFDALCSFGMMRRRALEQMPLHLIGKRYDFENTQLIAMSIGGVHILDYPVPAKYGEETSTIKLWSTSWHIFSALFVGFWRRMYYKYVVRSFHPVALFLFGGIFMGAIGTLFGLYISYKRLFDGVTPSTATVMLVVVPLILGFQLVLAAITTDIENEKK
ncbi:MAG TPA: glycosyltransferase family 2 protein [Candidatus Saccharimonadales bacterium]|nr:glycosyltransferase family 2 protein [Candidatus Saccharimonadales bacterium]